MQGTGSLNHSMEARKLRTGCVYVCVCGGGRQVGTLRSPSCVLKIYRPSSTRYKEGEGLGQGRWNRRGPTAQHSILQMKDLTKGCSASQLSNSFLSRPKILNTNGLSGHVIYKNITYKTYFLKSEANAGGKGCHGMQGTTVTTIVFVPWHSLQTSATPHQANLRTEKQRAGG